MFLFTFVRRLKISCVKFKEMDAHGNPLFYTVSQKRDPDIIDCNFKKD